MEHQPSTTLSPPLSSLSTSPVSEVRRRAALDPHGDNFGSGNPQSTMNGSDNPTLRPLSPSTFTQKQDCSETTRQQDQSHRNDPSTELIEKPLSHDAQTARRPSQVFGAMGMITEY